MDNKGKWNTQKYVYYEYKLTLFLEYYVKLTIRHELAKKVSEEIQKLVLILNIIIKRLETSGIASFKNR